MGRSRGSRGRSRGQKAWGVVVDSAEVAAAAAADELVGLRVADGVGRGAGRRGRSGRGRGSSRSEDRGYRVAQANGVAPAGCNTTRAEDVAAGGDQHLHVIPQQQQRGAGGGALGAGPAEAHLRPDVPPAAGRQQAGAGAGAGAGAAEGAPAGNAETDTSPRPCVDGDAGKAAAVGGGGCGEGSCSGGGDGGGDGSWGGYGSEGSSSGSGAGGGGSQLTPFGPPLSHLSPLRVTLTLGPRYPSEEPPAVELQVGLGVLGVRGCGRSNLII